MKLHNKIKYNLHIDYSAFMYIVPPKKNDTGLRSDVILQNYPQPQGMNFRDMIK